MSKRRIRDRKKKIRRIKRIRCVVLSGMAVAFVATAALIAYHTITPEPIAVIQTEPIAPELYIETEEIPRSYKDVDFVPLPVPMTDADQEIVFGICQEYGVAFPLVMAIIENESHFDRTAR